MAYHQPNDIDLAMAELSSAEAYFQFFHLEFDPDWLQRQRIALMRAFRYCLDQKQPEAWTEYRDALKQACCLVDTGKLNQLSRSPCQSCSGCE